MEGVQNGHGPWLVTWKEGGGRLECRATGAAHDGGRSHVLGGPGVVVVPSRKHASNCPWPRAEHAWETTPNPFHGPGIGLARPTDTRLPCCVVVMSTCTQACTCKDSTSCRLGTEHHDRLRTSPEPELAHPRVVSVHVRLPPRPPRPPQPFFPLTSGLLLDSTQTLPDRTPFHQQPRPSKQQASPADATTVHLLIIHDIIMHNSDIA